MDTDAQETLKDGSSLEAKNHGNWKCIAFRIYFFPFKLAHSMYSSLFVSFCAWITAAPHGLTVLFICLVHVSLSFWSELQDLDYMATCCLYLD
jgi:hypothetical protein